MNFLQEVINASNIALAVMGAIIVMWGVCLALLDFVKKESGSGKGGAVKSNEAIRIKLESYMVLGLGFFMAGYLIRTLVFPTWTGVGILASIAVIRAVLGYLLSKDMSKI